MLTFKQTVILLVSIITVLAIVAIVTGLSPLYWPRPKTLAKENNSTLILTVKTTSKPNLKTQITTRFKTVTKKILPLATVNVIATLPITTNTASTNATII